MTRRSTATARAWLPGGLLLMALVLAPLAAHAAVDETLFDGDAVPLTNPSCGEYAQPAPGAGVDGTVGLRLSPDKWHEAAINLYCGGQPRRNFTAHEVIEMRMRAETAGGSPTFRVRTWDALGNEVSIAQYTEGGVIDETWRLVRIPLADLATPEWSMGNVERLLWGKDPESRIYYVDNVALRDLSGPKVLSLTPMSNRVLRVELSERFDLDGARAPEQYTLTSTMDTAYASGAHPVDVGVQVRFRDFGSGNEALSHHFIFLRLPEPMKTAQAYALTIEGITDDAGNPAEATTIPFEWDDLVNDATAIKVNQVGYVPGRPKYGYVGEYLGDLGGAFWAVGDGGRVARWRPGKGWDDVSSPVGTTLRAVAATTEELALAVGDGGVVLRWDGEQWSKLTSGTTEALHGVTFGPTRTGWIVGAGGVALRWKDGELTPTPTPTKATLRAVWAGPNDAAWAVGDSGTLLQWTGSAWTSSTSPTTSDLLAIAAVGTGQIFAVGANGTVLGRQWGNWKVWAQTPKTNTTLRGITTNPSGAVWVTGDGGLVWRRAKFGSDAFTPEASGTTAALHGLARLDERSVLAMGDDARMRTADGWQSAGAPMPGMRAVAALPYGAMRIAEPAPDVTIFDAETGETAFSAPLELRYANWEMSGEDVWQFDFSGLTAPGTYRAYVPGVGVSPPFKVGTDALDAAAYATARSFYYQRCGEELAAPHVDSGYERGLCHSAEYDAAYHSSLAGTPLYAGEQAGATIDAAGGWHDAGDFGKYMPTAVAALWYLLEGYELDPTKFTDGAWNIPESGNGVPDVLDEAQVGLDWIVKIQRKDGAFPHKVTAECWFNGMPEDEHVQRYIFEHTTHDTATAAAVLASGARVYATIDPERAEVYLDGAELAWSFLASHPNAAPAGGFKNPSGNCTGDYHESDEIDNRMWAAAELYRTTGEAPYRQAFEGWWQSHGKEWGWNDWQHHYRKAYWAYLRAEKPGDAGIRGTIRDTLLSQADTLVSNTHANPYMNGTRLDVPEWIGWGAFTMGPKSAFPLLQAYALTGEEGYADMAALNADAQLGVNPLSMSFITGVGARSPLNPLDMESEYDSNELPVPGLPLFGPHHNQSKGNPFQVATQADANNYPYTWTTDDPLPILRRFNDAFELPMMTEFTVTEQALTTVTLHLLAETTEPLPPACGGPAACDDGNPCTKDACLPDLGCVSTPNSAPCNDGDPCTGGDVCAGGLCIGTPGACTPGPDGEPPTEPPPTEPPPTEPPPTEPPTVGGGHDPSAGSAGGPATPGGPAGGLPTDTWEDPPFVQGPSQAPVEQGDPNRPQYGPSEADPPSLAPGGDTYLTIKGCSTGGRTDVPLAGAALLLVMAGALAVGRRRAEAAARRR